MTDRDIKKMVKELIAEVDHDIYEGLFVSPEEKDVAKEKIQTLIEIVKIHLM